MYMYSISILPSYTSFYWSILECLLVSLWILIETCRQCLIDTLTVTYSDLSTLLQSLIDTHTFTHIHSYQLVEAIEYLNSILWNHFQSSCPFIIHSRKSINNYQMTIYYSIFNCRILSQKSLSNPIGLHSIDPLNPKIE